MCFSDQKSKEEVDGIDTENLAVLERLKQSQRDEYLKVTNLDTKKKTTHLSYIVQVYPSFYFFSEIKRPK